MKIGSYEVIEALADVMLYEQSRKTFVTDYYRNSWREELRKWLGDLDTGRL